jgi:suppressor of ftsI
VKTETQSQQDASTDLSYRTGTSNIDPTANSRTAMLKRIVLGCSDDPRQEARKCRKGGSQSFIGFVSADAVFSFLLLGCSSQGAAPSDRAFISQDALPELPIARGPLTLEAVNDPHSGKGSFSYEGHEIPPVIHVSPGETLRIDYRNLMSLHSTEQCASGPCMNMTNLHFHGLHVSPESPQDDTISMMAMPGESIQYRVDIPLDQPPGLYWYHTHPHGESYRQALDGMSGAIVIDGIDRYVPEVRAMKERILILRDAELRAHDPHPPLREKLAQLLDVRCSASSEVPERIFTVNGVAHPTIAIAPGERQFWHIVNASPDLYADLRIDSEQMTVVARDGMPLAFHDPERHPENVEHILLPPAGRVEAIVTGPRAGVRASLRSSCVDTGRSGDANPAMVLADLDPGSYAHPLVAQSIAGQTPPVYKPVSAAFLAKYESRAPDYSVRFNENLQGAYFINRRKYSPEDGPMTTVQIGDYQHWHVLNDTSELHPFHIHQVHFLAYKTNGKAEAQPEWLDTVNVPAKGSVDLIMDFTDPIIRGTSLFHCHLLKHEDQGMMAKILFK